MKRYSANELTDAYHSASDAKDFYKGTSFRCDN